VENMEIKEVLIYNLFNYFMYIISFLAMATGLSLFRIP
jgi:hypothetical protein